jgi:hypothetical protein
MRKETNIYTYYVNILIMGLKKDILQEIEKQQLRWYGHVMRMENCKIAR